jgi:trimethylamine-N-oxide reductase (cytochrome c)
MYWRYGGSFFGTMQQTNRYVKAYREGGVRTVVNQSIWMEGEAKFADIILPACTNFERWDMSEFGNCSGYIPDNHNQTNHRVIVFQKKCIEPLGESKSDYDIFAAVWWRMGDGSPRRPDDDWCRRTSPTDLPAHHLGVREEGYFVVPFPTIKSTPGHALVR